MTIPMGFAFARPTLTADGATGVLSATSERVYLRKKPTGVYVVNAGEVVPIFEFKEYVDHLGAVWAREVPQKDEYGFDVCYRVKVPTGIRGNPNDAEATWIYPTKVEGVTVTTQQTWEFMRLVIQAPQDRFLNPNTPMTQWDEIGPYYHPRIAAEEIGPGGTLRGVWYTSNADVQRIEVETWVDQPFGPPMPPGP